MTTSADGSEPIQLRVSSKVAYVWDVDGMFSFSSSINKHTNESTYASDIATIRSEHRICGILTGTLPHLSQQNVFLGVPLVLMPEEAVLLVDIGELVLNKLQVCKTMQD